jgi:AraC-like DNA-binding protein
MNRDQEFLVVEQARRLAVNKKMERVAGKKRKMLESMVRESVLLPLRVGLNFRITFTAHNPVTDAAVESGFTCQSDFNTGFNLETTKIQQAMVATPDLRRLMRFSPTNILNARVEMRPTFTCLPATRSIVLCGYGIPPKNYSQAVPPSDSRITAYNLPVQFPGQYYAKDSKFSSSIQLRFTLVDNLPKMFEFTLDASMHVDIFNHIAAARNARSFEMMLAVAGCRCVDDDDDDDCE